ncbi:MAG: Flp pilus assembly complex ATPase component TadA, partial [Actinomycetota bacterium]|nr:Flp pilus assembly complex ATPase component TadA [Actinomycetota bacterium]
MEAAAHPWPALGALLLRDGALTVEQLEQALRDKDSSGRRLGEILVDRGYVTPTQVSRVLAEQHELPFIDLARETVDMGAAGLLSEDLARRYNAIPVRFLADGAVLVAVNDPTNVVAGDDLRIALGATVRVGVASGDAIANAITRIYSGELDFDEGPDVEEESGATVVDLREAAASAPAIKQVNAVLSRAIDLGASDVHFTPQRRRLLVRARVDGVMRELATIPKTLQPAVTSRLKVMAELDIAEKRAPQDGRLSLRTADRSIDLRVAVLPTTFGEKVTLRIMGSGEAAVSLEELGMSESAAATLAGAVGQPFGAVIAVGPTGSGKSTTLHAALSGLDSEERQITTIEDPVEYQVPNADQIEVNPRAGLTFATGLRTILRSDPDVILVGEIRDEETADIAFQAAMTGHLVLSSLHAQNAASAIARLKDMGVDPGLIATSLNCIVAQRLARKLCQSCREAYVPDADELAAVGLPEFEYGRTHLYRAAGCESCSFTGYTGRVGLFEVMPIRGELRGLIERSTEEIFAAAVEAG